MESVYSLKNNPIVRKIFMTMLFPTILMNLTTAIGSMADAVIIGQYLDDLSLSVVTFATPIYMIINTLAALFAVGGCIAMSIEAGKGDKKEANRAFSLSMEFLVFTGVLLFIAGLFFSHVIAKWLGAGEDIFEQVRVYSRIILLGGPVFVLNIAIAFFVRNDGRPNLAMAGMFTSIFVDIVLNVVFVGFMKMGVDGAAYSTVIGQIVSMAVISSHFFTSKNTLRFRFTFGKAVFRMIKNGASSALTFVYQFLTVLILNHFVVALAGTNGVVVYTVVFNLYTVSLALFEGLSQTIQPMVSVYFGEKSNRKIKDSLRLAFIATIIICGAVTVLLELMPQIIPQIFGINDPSIMEQSVQAVRIYAISMIIMTVNVIIGYYLQSAEYNLMAAILVSLRGCILFLASVFVLGKMFGMNGVWGAYTVAEVLSFVVYIIMNQAKRCKLRKSGTETDWFLLNKATEKETLCYTCNCQRNDLKEFNKEVIDLIEDNSYVSKAVFLDAKEYLLQLEKCDLKKKGAYAEVEINGTDKKVIIRDNLKHDTLQENIRDCIQNGSESEYGPVLGWNRICLK